MFDEESRRKLGMDTDRFEDLEAQFLGQKIPVVPSYIDQDAVLEGGHRSVDQYVLMTHMQWTP